MKTIENYMEISQLCKNNGLEMIDATFDGSGYPGDEKIGIIGFDSLFDAQEFASNKDGRVVHFYQKYGWNTWSILNDANTEYDSMDLLNELGNDYCLWGNTDIDIDYLIEELKTSINTCQTFEHIENEVGKFKKLIEKIEQCPENHSVISFCGGFWGYVKDKSMRMSYDSKSFEIGVLLF